MKLLSILHFQLFNQVISYFLTFRLIFNIFMLMSKSKKEKTRFVCQSCGYDSPKWMGRCTECGEWSSFIEEKVLPKIKERSLIHKEISNPIPLSQINFQQHNRILTKNSEFNRVLGGGIVLGSATLVGGDPGIGKSTIMLQEGAKIASDSFKVLYISGEESNSQIKMRANRLSVDSDQLLIISETNLDLVIEHIERCKPNLVIVDSIQTIYSSMFDSAPGSVSQIRECAYQFINLAKTKDIPLFLIGHVTKEGFIAGPKVLEHMVDTLLYFEGDKNNFYRILRAVKNRFGSTNEIGVFEMTEKGLLEVSNPSEMFLSERNEDTPGSNIICVLEGTRPIMLEIQALISLSNYGYPQRTTTGVDVKRLAIMLAVLEKRVGIRVGKFDVFVNAVGGVRIDETAADLGIAVAIVSSMKNIQVNPKTVIIGELGLGGEIRAVSQIDKRIIEAEKLGFSNAIIPASNKISKDMKHIKIYKFEKLHQVIEHLF